MSETNTVTLSKSLLSIREIRNLSSIPYGQSNFYLTYTNYSKGINLSMFNLMHLLDRVLLHFFEENKTEEKKENETKEEEKEKKETEKKEEKKALIKQNNKNTNLNVLLKEPLLIKSKNNLMAIKIIYCAYLNLIEKHQFKTDDLTLSDLNLQISQQLLEDKSQWVLEIINYGIELIKEQPYLMKQGFIQEIINSDIQTCNILYIKDILEIAFVSDYLKIFHFIEYEAKVKYNEYNFQKIYNGEIFIRGHYADTALFYSSIQTLPLFKILTHDFKKHFLLNQLFSGKKLEQMIDQSSVDINNSHFISATKENILKHVLIGFSLIQLYTINKFNISNKNCVDTSFYANLLNLDWHNIVTELTNIIADTDYDMFLNKNLKSKYKYDFNIEYIQNIFLNIDKENYEQLKLAISYFKSQTNKTHLLNNQYNYHIYDKSIQEIVNQSLNTILIESLNKNNVFQKNTLPYTLPLNEIKESNLFLNDLLNVDVLSELIYLEPVLTNLNSFVRKELNIFKDVDIVQNSFNINLIPKLQELNKEYPHFHEVTDFFIDYIEYRRSDYIKPILISGGNKIGKQTYLFKLFDILETPYLSKDCLDIQGSEFFYGLNKFWGNAEQGELYKFYQRVQLSETQHKRGFVYLKNPNHVLPESNKNRFSKEIGLYPKDILPLLKEETCKKYSDNFEPNVEHDIRNLIMVFTVNKHELNNVPSEILNACKLFEVPNLSDDVKQKWEMAIIEKQWHFYNKSINQPLDLNQFIQLENNLFNNHIKMIEIHKLKSDNIDFIHHLIHQYIEICFKHNKHLPLDEWTLPTNQEIDDMVFNLNVKNLHQLSNGISVVLPEQITELDKGFKSIFGNKNAKKIIKNNMNLFKLKLENSFSPNHSQLSVLKDIHIKGMIMYGEPGVGKTMFGKAIAKECGIPFIYLNASVFSQKYVGDDVLLVNSLFKVARETAPCVVFIDEIDGLGSRNSNVNHKNDLINTFLTQLDGIHSNNLNNEKPILFIGATNYLEKLDKALIRSGRLDEHIKVEIPNAKDRTKFIKKLIKSKYNDMGVDFSQCNLDFNEISKMTFGYSGADLVKFVNKLMFEYCVNQKSINMKLVSNLLEELDLGGKTIKENKKDRLVTAYHEAGHACLSYLLNGHDKVNRVTIIPRSKSLGLTYIVPNDGNYKNKTQQEILNTISVILGGTCAEKHFFNVETTGARSDISNITSLTKKMVCEYGFAMFNHKLKSSYINFEELHNNSINAEIQEEIINIVKHQHKRTMKIMKQYEKFIKDVAKLLFKKEVIFFKDIDEIAKKHKLKSNILDK